MPRPLGRGPFTMIGADINGLNLVRKTALFCAVEQGNDDMVALLLQHKADATIKTVVGSSPLNITPGITKDLPVTHPSVQRIRKLLAQAQASEKELKQQEEVSNSSE